MVRIEREHLLPEWHPPSAKSCNTPLRSIDTRSRALGRAFDASVPSLVQLKVSSMIAGSIVLSLSLSRMTLDSFALYTNIECNLNTPAPTSFAYRGRALVTSHPVAMNASISDGMQCRRAISFRNSQLPFFLVPSPCATGMLGKNILYASCKLKNHF